MAKNRGKRGNQEVYNKFSLLLVALFIAAGLAYSVLYGQLSHLYAKEFYFSQFEGNTAHLYNVSEQVRNISLHINGSIVVPPTIHGELMVATYSVMNDMSPNRSYGGVVAINITTDTVIWNKRMPNEVMTQPIIAGGIAVVGVGNNALRMNRSAEGYLVRIRGDGISYIAAINLTTGDLVWRFNTIGADMATPVYYNGDIIEASGNGAAYSLNASTGKEVWGKILLRPPTIQNGSNQTTFPAGNFTNRVPNNYPIVPVPNNYPVSPNAAVNGYPQNLGYKPPGYFDSMSSLTLLDGIVYFSVTDPGIAYAMNATTGNIVWAAHFPAVGGTGDTSSAINLAANVIIEGYSGPKSHFGVEINNSPIPPNTLLNTSSYHKFIQPVLAGVNLTNGNVIWSFNESIGIQPIKPPIELTPITMYNGMAFSDTPASGTLYAINSTNGRMVWSFRTGIDASNPNVFGGYLFLDSSNGTVFTLYLNGTLVSEHNLGVPMGPGEPVVIGDKLLLYGTNGMIKTVPLAYLENRSS